MSGPDREVWDGMLSYLRAQHPDICRQWFEEIDPLGFQNGTFNLRAHSQIHRDYLERQCSAAFQDALQETTGHLGTVRFLGPSDEVNCPPEPLARSLADSPHIPSAAILNPDYAFNTFVVGPGNRYAHAAAMAVAEKPGQAYNPLFIHGSVGLGKTHLLQAICLRVKEENPRAMIQYFSCEQFVTHFTEAIQAGQMNQFRHWFRDADVLVIDDIHFLGARERTQEEFFHTFNTLHGHNRQIVLSSDAPPEHIPDLEDRLVSRFKWGLVTPIEPPDYETRVMILKTKARIHEMKLPDDVACHIAARIDSNIRELEGAIKQLKIAISTDHEPLTVDLARKALGEKRASNTGGATIQKVIDVVSEYYSIKITDLHSRRKQRSVVLPRQICMYLIRQHTPHSHEEIGGYFGGRHHTTVMHAVERIRDARKVDRELDLTLETLEAKLLK